MKQPIIFGAGLAGLIAARMMADKKPMVYERQAQLPNNHAAVLRFRTDRVATATNIPFRKVNVLKSMLGHRDPVKDAIAYSRKVTGKIQPRSAINLDPVERYIAPSDLISRLAVTADIHYNKDFIEWSSNLIDKNRPPVISTMPIPFMMDAFKWKDKPNFSSATGWTAKCKIRPELQADLFCTTYNSFPCDENFDWYRASITGDEIMIEGVGQPSDEFKNFRELTAVAARDAFGLRLDDLEDFSISKAKYQKIVDLDFTDRESCKAFIMYLSKERGIFSLGRFATWRPKLLLDDIVNDVRVIERLISGATNYDFNKD